MKPETVRLEELSPSVCLRLVEERVPKVGRVGFLREDYPVILPVNYRVFHGQVVFRTELGTVLDSLVTTPSRERLAFEVDAVDETWREGWSVLIQGTANEIAEGEEFARLQGLPLQSWAPGDKPRYIRIEPVAITGRRIA